MSSSIVLTPMDGPSKVSSAPAGNGQARVDEPYFRGLPRELRGNMDPIAQSQSTRVDLIPRIQITYSAISSSLLPDCVSHKPLPISRPPALHRCS